MKKNSFFIIGILLFFSSCSNEICRYLLRTYNDPVDEPPFVDSFMKENTSYISWNKDEGADIYIIKRFENTTSGFTNEKEIYRGRNLNCIDDLMENEKSYVYRLDKIRGNEITGYFTGTKYGYGYSGKVLKDSLENNDCCDKAVLFELDADCNLYCIKYYDDKVLKDEDWFYIDVMPRRVTYIGVDTDDGNYKYLQYKTVDSAQGLQDISKDKGIELVNKSDNIERIYFTVFINSEKVSKVQTVSYELKFLNTKRYE